MARVLRQEIEFLNSLVSDVQDKNKTIERQIADFAIASSGDVSQWHNNTEVKPKFHGFHPWQGFAIFNHKNRFKGA